MRGSWRVLLFALGADNFGTGLFLPLVLLYLTRIVGLPLGVAGIALTVGALAGFLAPPAAGMLMGRTSPRATVVAAQLLQAAGMCLYLTARDAGSVIVAAVLIGMGQQLFYCALFVLVADVAGDGPKERPFAVVTMIRTACFGIGALVAGGLLELVGLSGYRMAVAGNAVSFVIAAALLMVWVRAPRIRRQVEKPVRVTRNRPYLTLIAVSGFFGLSVDFFLVGTPVFVLDRLHAPGWLPGAVLALFTLVTSVGGTPALRHTEGLNRIAAMRVGLVLFGVWCVVSLGAVLVPAGWVPGYLLSATLLLAAGELVFGPRSGALAEAAAPPAARGRYLAAYQYAFSSAQVLAPAVAALFSLAVWLPWALVAGCACLAVAGLGWLGPRLPRGAVTPIQS